MITVGKLILLVLKAWAASLKRMRSTLMRFSVPSSWTCRSRKFCVALRSGYFSTTTIKRDRAEDSPSWACWNLAKASGLLAGLLPRLHLADLGAGFGHGGKGIFFKGGRALDGLHQVGDQVGAALVGVFHLAPLRKGFLVQGDQAVVGAHHPQTRISTTRPIRIPRRNPKIFFIFISFHCIDFKIRSRSRR